MHASLLDSPPSARTADCYEANPLEARLLRASRAGSKEERTSRRVSEQTFTSIILSLNNVNLCEVYQNKIFDNSKQHFL